MAKLQRPSELPEGLYHGSAFKCTGSQLHPAAHYSTRRANAEGYSPRYLYATRDRDMAIAYGFKRALEQSLRLTFCHFYDDARIISVRSLKPLSQVQLDSQLVFLYEIRPTHAQDWICHNTSARENVEFKTRHPVPVEQALWINMEHWLKNRELIIRPL